MKKASNWYLKCVSIGLLLIISGAVHSARLVVDAEAPQILHIAAAILLYVHISSGAFVIVSGTLASLFKKGQAQHRMAGKVFFVSMFICFLTGAVTALFLDTEQRTNFVAAVLSLYLLATGMSAAKRKVFTAGIQEKIGLVIALSITISGLSFMIMSSQSPTGTVDDAPAEAFVLFVLAGTLASIGDIRAIIRKKLTPKARIIRHLWRMCFAFFIASGSFFFGQMAFLPEWFNASVFPLLFGFFPIAVLLITLFKYLNPYKFLKQKLINKQSAKRS